MAKGKFSKQRTPKSEEAEMEEAFRELTGEPQNSPADAWDEDVPSPAIEKNKKIVLISLCCVALMVLIGLVVTIGYLFSGTADDGLILNNVTVAGVNLGGMTREQAAEALHKATDLTYTNTDMVILLPDTTLTLTPANTGASVDVEAVVEAAYHYGRTGGKAEQAAARAQILTGEYHIALLPYLTLDTDYILRQLQAYAAGYNSTYCESSYEFDGEMPALDAEGYDPEAPCQTLLLNPGTPGRYVDANSIYNMVLDAYSFNIFQVDARDSEPGQEPEPLDLDAIFEEYCVEAVDAAFDTETYEVIPESYGYTFDLERARELLAEAQPGTVIGIPMEYVEPEVLGVALEELLFRDVLASYQTAHTNNANRNTNLRLACAAINGLILNPGEEFSYNSALGKRTEEAGYKPAGAYVNGETVEELGGGICQVSSTLYYCTLMADLQITARRAHTYVSSYMPLGMDATVSWGGPEFKFVNNTNFPLRIEAEVSGGYVRVQLVGTDEKDYYVKMEYEILDTREPETVYKDYPADNDKGYTNGQVIQTAYTGYTVKSYMCKYSKETDQLLSRDYVATSTYSSRDQIIAKVPTEEVTEPPTEAPTEEPTEAPTEEPTEAPTESESVDTP